MRTLESTSLSEAERRVLDRVVAGLREDLGDELVAVWLYGSRARGEPPRDEDSDVDVLVLTRQDGQRDGRLHSRIVEAAEAEGLSSLDFSFQRQDLAWLYGRRAIRAFFVEEVDRDKVVLFANGMSPRSEEYIDFARQRLAAARRNFEADDLGVTSVLAYNSMLNAARAALSERDLFAKTHKGTWLLVRQHLVLEGVDAALVTAAEDAGKRREYADYGAKNPTPEEARADLEAAERFLAAVERLLP